MNTETYNIYIQTEEQTGLSDESSNIQTVSPVNTDTITTTEQPGNNDDNLYIEIEEQTGLPSESSNIQTPTPVIEDVDKDTYDDIVNSLEELQNNILLKIKQNNIKNNLLYLDKDTLETNIDELYYFMYFNYLLLCKLNNNEFTYNNFVVSDKLVINLFNISNILDINYKDDEQKYMYLKSKIYDYLYDIINNVYVINRNNHRNNIALRKTTIKIGNTHYPYDKPISTNLDPLTKSSAKRSVHLACINYILSLVYSLTGKNFIKEIRDTIGSGNITEYYVNEFIHNKISNKLNEVIQINQLKYINIESLLKLPSEIFYYIFAIIYNLLKYSLSSDNDRQYPIIYKDNMDNKILWLTYLDMPEMTYSAVKKQVKYQLPPDDVESYIKINDDFIKVLNKLKKNDIDIVKLIEGIYDIFIDYYINNYVIPKNVYNISDDTISEHYKLYLFNKSNNDIIIKKIVNNINNEDIDYNNYQIGYNTNNKTHEINYIVYNNAFKSGDDYYLLIESDNIVDNGEYYAITMLNNKSINCSELFDFNYINNVINQNYYQVPIKFNEEIDNYSRIKIFYNKYKSDINLIDNFNELNIVIINVYNASVNVVGKIRLYNLSSINTDNNDKITNILFDDIKAKRYDQFLEYDDESKTLILNLVHSPKLNNTDTIISTGAEFLLDYYQEDKKLSNLYSYDKESELKYKKGILSLDDNYNLKYNYVLNVLYDYIDLSYIFNNQYMKYIDNDNTSNPIFICKQNISNDDSENILRYLGEYDIEYDEDTSVTSDILINFEPQIIFIDDNEGEGWNIDQYYIYTHDFHIKHITALWKQYMLNFLPQSEGFYTTDEFFANYNVLDLYWYKYEYILHDKIKGIYYIKYTLNIKQN